MKLTYYGTAAAEGWPGMFCRCASCERARAAGGRNVRTRSQALVNDDLLLDLPEDTYLHVLNYGLDLTRVRSLLVTHPHLDHFVPEELWCRSHGIAYELRPEAPLLTVYGGEGVARKLGRMADYQPDRVTFVRLVRGETVRFDGYEVTPLEADHAPGQDAMIFAVSDGKSRLLYAHDTGYLTDSAWAWIETEKPRFDLVSLDCTNIVTPGRRGHMDLEACGDVKARLLSCGAADEKTVFVLNHFSHNGKLTYDELCRRVGDEFLVSYDGMSVTF
ncbi:MAG: hypothetical protein IJL69_05930 [Oscillospiraceae bacterium]|nr:hypothetical protein [Oscillospiraceae bacterium]